MKNVGRLVRCDREVSDAIERLENDPDRVAAVLAGAIVEIRLSGAIRHRLRDPRYNEAFRRSSHHGRSLGGFSKKIEIAHLLGILSEEAFADLKVMASIRNSLANKLKMLSFSTPNIRDRCFSFKIVESKLRGISRDELAAPFEGQENSDEKLPSSFGEDSDDLRDARNRYITTAQVISAGLSQAANPDAPEPLI